MSQALLDAIKNKQAKVGVIGLGYVGLPLIDAFVSKGFRTIGYDIDTWKCEQLSAGKSYIKHISSERVLGWQKEGRFEATADMRRLAEADALLICVPTPLNDSRDPDLSYVEGTAKSIAATLRPGQLVILESTTHPTTTRDNVLPLLEATGLKAGKDYYLAYSPEREDPGNPNFSAASIPKVVGGFDPHSLELAKTLYSQAVVSVVPVSSLEVAEACKILENTYRAVNIALVNELKQLFDRMGIDIWEVVDAAKTKPFGFQAFYPGPGLGGHCIPIDPFYLTWLARKHGLTTRFIELAGEVNARMPEYVITRLAEFLNEQGKPIKGSQICVLGAAYKKDVDDMRESPSLRVITLLKEKGAEVVYHDPYIPKIEKGHGFNYEMSSTPLENVGAYDVVVILTDHTEIDYPTLVANAQLVVDTRNATQKVTRHREKIVKA